MRGELARCQCGIEQKVAHPRSLQSAVDFVRRPVSDLIFRFATVNAEQSILDQHREIRRLFREGEARPWSDWNLDAVTEWLAMRGGGA